ncbi:MAG: hypothetical protein LBT47_05500 [Deltaproteobacteria bacterium]|jgi:hypothetical protein|nr:hypothetical protein [Deltaproteobacteria bacterium]
MAGEMRRQIGAAALGPAEKTKPPSEDFLKTSEVWRRCYRFEPNFVGFQGHFENYPVLPALAQVFIALDMVQALLNHQVTLEAVTQAKFLSPVPPRQLLSVYAPIIDNPGEWRLLLTSRAENELIETNAAFLRLKFKKDANGL